MMQQILEYGSHIFDLNSVNEDFSVTIAKVFFIGQLVYFFN